MFDIYITKFPAPNLIADEYLASLLAARPQDTTGVWLGLSIPYQSAALLAKAITTARGFVKVIAEEYRHPKIATAQALPIAYKEIMRKRDLATIEMGIPVMLGEVVLYGLLDSPRVWIFSAQSPTLQNLGYMPGSIAVNIDKLTGEIVTDHELMADSDRLRLAQGEVFPDE
ncbi:hypothetical protein [Leptospira alexanderi]|uniref:hypothetical protein n=1 Tax=Leptospira alexanderi TaxID=100053 RepID=UPI00099113FB|nr:hypothetical protein [Leptospira alexanderi]